MRTIKLIWRYAGLLSLSATLAACGGGDGRNDGSRPVVEPGLHAFAGPDQDVSRGQMVFLDGGTSSRIDATAGYRWTQTTGVDVTGGTGFFNGITASFSAPHRVGTVLFELSVNDGANEATDSIQINIMEDPARAVFVNGDSGSDKSGDGSRQKPFATIEHALSQAKQGFGDLYVATRRGGQVYTLSATLDLGAGISLYGGYNHQWIRDTAIHKTRILSAATPIIRLLDFSMASISGLELSHQGALEGNAIGLLGDNGDVLVIQDNVIRSGDSTTASGGFVRGIMLSNVDTVEIDANEITAGRAGDGMAGSEGNNGSEGKKGTDGRTGLQTGIGGINPEIDFLQGGEGGHGQLLHPLTCELLSAAQRGQGELGGEAASGGDGGDGVDATVPGAHASVSAYGFQRINGASGTDGWNGTPGSGGGGGNGFVSPEGCTQGGAGGGGGGGASAGRGGQGGDGGGMSSAVNLFHINTAVLINNTITSGDGGGGGRGGNGGLGASGGAGGRGGASDGTAGGAGGRGGHSTAAGDGGGGNGGSSLGIYFSDVAGATIRNNQITTGQGGRGGGGRHGAAGSGGFSIGIQADQVIFTVIQDNRIQAGPAGEAGTSDGDGIDGLPGVSAALGGSIP